MRGMQKMHEGMAITYSGHVDSDFVRGMIPHHQGAVDMAEVVLRYGVDPQVRSLAQWIRRAQIGEIGIMRRWLETVGKDAPAAESEETLASDAYRESMLAMKNMHRDMNIRYSGDADRDFVCGMIPHHQGAIDMATIEITSGGNPKMLKFASKIIRAQTNEIAIMQRWLKRKNVTCALSEEMSHHHHH